MLTFASHELNEQEDSYYNLNYDLSGALAPRTKIYSAKLFADKICIPQIPAIVNRARLTTHLEKSLAQFSAVLITGRTGTGKTTLAADFARRTNYAVVWYKVDTADSELNVFTSYLTTSLNRHQFDGEAALLIEHNNLSAERKVPQTTETLSAQIAAVGAVKPLLVVLDDFHTVFDAVWFVEFFNNLLSTPIRNAHFLLIARHAPPFPLWRMRSKQMLGVMEEKLLNFTLEETIEFFESYKISAKAARTAHAETDGKISRLKQIAENSIVSVKTVRDSAECSLDSAI